MTVFEVIKILSKMPSDAKVVVAGYEEGVDDITDTLPCRIRKTESEWWSGDYSVESGGDINAVFLKGKDRSPTT